MDNTFTDTFLVTFTNTPPNQPLLVVGRQLPKQAPVILNGFTGDQAFELYKLLTTTPTDKNPS